LKTPNFRVKVGEKGDFRLKWSMVVGNGLFLKSLITWRLQSLAPAIHVISFNIVEILLYYLNSIPVKSAPKFSIACFNSSFVA